MFVTHSRGETRLGGGGRAMMEVRVGGAHAGILMHTSIDVRWVRCGKLWSLLLQMRLQVCFWDYCLGGNLTTAECGEEK